MGLCPYAHVHECSHMRVCANRCADAHAQAHLNARVQVHTKHCYPGQHLWGCKALLAAQKDKEGGSMGMYRQNLSVC